MDYFELFDVPVSLKVNKAEILKKYYQLSRQYHPDNFSLMDENAQQESLAISAKVNEAKKVLDDSYKRLAYILQQKKVITPEEKYQLSPIFLAEMMDINEQLMELEFDKNEATLSKIKKEIADKEDELYEEVRKYFESDELHLTSADNNILKEYYYKKKYLHRILDKLV